MPIILPSHKYFDQIIFDVTTVAHIIAGWILYFPSDFAFP